jgi:hypothetical protein
MRKTEKNLKKILILLLSGYVLLVIILLLGAYFFKYFNQPVDWVTADPARSQSFFPLIGFGSHLGIILWCSTAAICLFTAVIRFKNDKKSIFWFLIFSALLSFFLLVDDLFEFHEVIFPVYLNISERYIYLGYILYTLSYLIFFRKQFLKLRYGLLILSIIFLSISVTLDQFFNYFPQIIEDSSKIMGIYTWFFFYVTSCHSFSIEGEGNEH